MGALRLAQLEPGCNTCCSKFYALKLHWFHSWLKPKCMRVSKSFIVLLKKTKSRLLTKALGPTAFKAYRLLSMGW